MAAMWGKALLLERSGKEEMTAKPDLIHWAWGGKGKIEPGQKEVLGVTRELLRHAEGAS